MDGVAYNLSIAHVFVSSCESLSSRLIPKFGLTQLVSSAKQGQSQFKEEVRVLMMTPKITLSHGQSSPLQPK